MLRTRTAGALSAADTETAVTLAGWVARRRDHGGVAFVDLRDASGVVQVVVRDEVLDSSGAHDLRNEYCVQVTGTVRRRPAGNENPALPTGEIEVDVAEITVLSTSDPLPFQVDEHVEVGEEARLKHRYLDLRRPGPAAAMRLRSEVNKAARTVLDQHGFVEVETPTLTRSTPEGARDFVVPARLRPGSFYALPQSPQLFKQLLMVGGLERYYQIARCYRDEDFRADRQPEFTQLDVEMSFVEQDDVIAVGEDVLRALWALVGHEITQPAAADHLRRRDGPLRQRQARPALRARADRLHRLLRRDPVPGVPAEGRPAATSAPSSCRAGPRSRARSSTPGRSGPSSAAPRAWPTCSWPRTAPWAARSPRTCPRTERAGLVAHVGASVGDCVFFGAGPASEARQLLGAARNEIARRTGLIEAADAAAGGKAWSFVWVVDAPLFEPAASATAAGDVAVGAGEWTAVHHAFTSPKPEFLDTFDTDPGSALAYAYDIVCNGNEIGGGSIRIHRRDVQERVFALMGIGAEAAQEKFGFLLDAFKFGAPPHGGIAFGWDRVVMLLAGAESLREVIAFPKSGGGHDPLTDAPGARSPRSSARRPGSTPGPRPPRPPERPARVRARERRPAQTSSRVAWSGAARRRSRARRTAPAGGAVAGPQGEAHGGGGPQQPAAPGPR